MRNESFGVFIPQKYNYFSVFYYPPIGGGGGGGGGICSPWSQQAWDPISSAMLWGVHERKTEFNNKVIRMIFHFIRFKIWQ